jgi:hypothetical protein
VRLAIVLFGTSASAAAEVAPRLAEIRADSLPPAVDFEYVEIAAPEGSELGPYAIVVIGDEDDALGPALGNSGVVESVVPLGGVSVPPGHALLVHAGSGPLAADLVADLRLEDADNLTVPGADLDLDDDGALDGPPWKEVVDGIALVWNAPGTLSEHVYAERQVGPLGGWFVFGARRCLDTDAWWPMASSFPDPFESTGTLNAPCQGVLCPGDIDQDGAVGPGDLAVLLGNWGMIGAIGDLDRNGRVEAADLAMLLGRWGPCDL